MVHDMEQEARKLMGGNLKVVWGRVFNFKLGCFVIIVAWPIQVQQSLELKTRPRFHPVSSSVSMYRHGAKMICGS
jgi:hypothetical protein